MQLKRPLTIAISFIHGSCIQHKGKKDRLQDYPHAIRVGVLKILRYTDNRLQWGAESHTSESRFRRWTSFGLSAVPVPTPA